MPARLSGFTLPVAAVVLALAMALPAAAQQIDETALRYYATQRQTQRVEAEAKRLALLHPGWTMPQDIWTARPGQADEKPLWALFTAGEMSRLKAAIAARQKAEAGWQPSDDLARKIRRKETRGAIMQRAAAAQWLGVAELAGDFDKLAESDDVELAWVVAEAFARTDRLSEAFALYKAVLTRRSDPRERIATIQKAIALLPIADVEGLLALGRAGESGGSEFAAIAIDITRARISAILNDQRRSPIEPKEFTAFEAYARAAPDAGQAGLVAWLALKQNRPSEALLWFKHAISRGGDAMIAHGLAHTLLRLGQKREAEEVAFAWREPLVNNAILFIDVLETDLTLPRPPAIEPERLARYAKVTLETRSGEGAQALGWYAYNSCQFETALDWFQRASAWLPKEATIFGQALSLQRLKRQRDVVELVNRYDGLFPKVVALVFGEGRDEPPGPCDAPRAQPAQERALSLGSLRVPSPDSATARSDAALIRRADFPVAVSPENPLRYGAGLPRDGAQRENWRAAAPDARPLVARRVPGVTAMPYERLGYALLPGWNGSAAASDVRAADQPPPRGTLWAQDLARQDPARQDLARQANVPVASAGRAVEDAATSRFRR